MRLISCSGPAKQDLSTNNMLLLDFFHSFKHYSIEILPALAIGFFLSGLIHEFIPTGWVEKNLGRGGVASVFYATIVGTILPICCWGSLPLAISFHKKGSRLGPILAFLVATPATSVSALLVSFKLLGIRFVVFEFFSVIVMGLIIGFIGNRFTMPRRKYAPKDCPHCDKTSPHTHAHDFTVRIKSVLKFAFYDLPKEIGLEIFAGIILASAVVSIMPIGVWIRQNLKGFLGYPFALVFSLLVYVCSTATVPLVDAFIKQGLESGAGMVLLLAGPITSYGTILVLKKEFGLKVLLFYLCFISVSSLLLGYLFKVIS
jgi:uncharacterized protein